MTEAARLVDELTTLLYTPFGTYRGRPQVACGACAKQADKPESVVHESDCPVYRLIRAEEANTAVIRANADEIADLEDKRDELEAQINGITAEITRERQMFADLTDASVRRIDALTTERDEARARAERAEAALRANAEWTDANGQPCWCAYDTVYDQHGDWCKQARAALAAASEGQQDACDGHAHGAGARQRRGVPGLVARSDRAARTVALEGNGCPQVGNAGLHCDHDHDNGRCCYCGQQREGE